MPLAYYGQHYCTDMALLSARAPKVEDLAFDNLRLARRAAALEEQLFRATSARSSLWCLMGGSSEQASESAGGASAISANDELVAKAQENEQLHIAIYEQARELTRKQRVEAAQRWALLEPLAALFLVRDDSCTRAVCTECDASLLDGPQRGLLC